MTESDRPINRPPWRLPDSSYIKRRHFVAFPQGVATCPRRFFPRLSGQQLTAMMRAVQLRHSDAGSLSNQVVNSRRLPVHRSAGNSPRFLLVGSRVRLCETRAMWIRLFQVEGMRRLRLYISAPSSLLPLGVIQESAFRLPGCRSQGILL